MPRYTFNHNGSTVGASGRRYRWQAGQPIEAPDGEFAHMDASTYSTGGAAYSTRPMQAEKAPAKVEVAKGKNAPGKSAPHRSISKGGGGWYTLTVDGEEAGKVRGLDVARAWQETGTLPD